MQLVGSQMVDPLGNSQHPICLGKGGTLGNGLTGPLVKLDAAVELMAVDTLLEYADAVNVLIARISVRIAKVTKRQRFIE